MGALHAGHASLIRAARAETRFVVVSIFVNPTQFGPHEDLDRYPRTFEEDRQQCTAEGADLIFAPEARVMYPEGFRTFVEVTALQDVLCGQSRPGHFRGVATVVLKLFNIVAPDIAYFGQKDAQQARLIRQMVHDLDVPIQVRVCPIIREADGLALSSRNRFLNPVQRQEATALYQALQAARQAIERGARDPGLVKQLMMAQLAAAPGAVVDYVEVVNATTLEPVHILANAILLALAVKFGTTRLIDNELISLK
jgi:pantoate--beta-alanine ligase